MEIQDKVAEVQLAYKPKIKERRKLIGSADSYGFLIQKCYNPNTISHHEEFKCVFLNNRLQMLGWSTISSGGISETIVDIRLILQYAILMNASCILCSHNHPSGSVKPSRDDDRLTERLKKACDVMNIKLLDHIIVTEDSFFSYSDEGKV